MELNERTTAQVDTSASRWMIVAMLALVIGGFLAYRLLSKPMGPPPPEVASDPLLLEGRAIYVARCLTCHGTDGSGDGPIASSLLGPPVGNLKSGKWKCGDKPDEVIRVIDRGVPETRMTGWGQVLDPPQLNAVAAYVYYLAAKPVPEELRASDHRQ